MEKNFIIFKYEQALFWLGHRVRQEKGGFSMMFKPRVMEDRAGDGTR